MARTQQNAGRRMPREIEEKPHDHSGKNPRVGVREKTSGAKRDVREENKPAPNAAPGKISGRAAVVLGLILLGIAAFLIGIAVKSCASSKKEDASAVTAAGKETSAVSETAAEEIPAADDDVPESVYSVLAPYRDSETKTFDPAIDAGYGIMIERSTGHIVAQRDPNERVYPASLTKIMTLIVAVENCESLDDSITFTHEIIYPFYKAGASMAGFENGETVTLRDMLYGLILPSGADAAEGICRVVGGDDAGFVRLMNAKVGELGLKNTHFANASGLHDPEQYSTCTELAIILDYAIQDPTCREVLSAYKYTTAATEQHPEGIELTSDLQARMEGGESGVARIIGGKTGFVNESRYCLATFAKADADGREYIIVTCLGSGRWKPIFDHINICKKYIGGLKIE